MTQTDVGWSYGGAAVTMAYVVYLRVSTQEQGRSGLGLEAQRRDVALYLEHYAPDADVIEEVVEVASGGADQREGLARALALCVEHKATLLVSKLDRLSRRVSFIASLLEDKRITFKVASMPHADAFQLHIHAALAEQERAFISLRTKQALAAAKARGVRLGTHRPAAAAATRRSKAAADEFARTHAQMITPMRDQGMTLRQIAAAMNSAQVKTRRGCEWTAWGVKNVLDRAAAGA